MSFPYIVTIGDSGIRTLSAVNEASEQPLLTVASNHMNYDAIVAGLDAGDPAVWELFDVVSNVLGKFKEVTDRVSWDGEQVLWDGEVVHDVIASQIERAIRTGESNYQALARFWEKLNSNPNPHSREQAYDWLASHSFKITEDGDVVGYKGVQATDKPGVYRSTARSQVNGVPSGFVNGNPLPERDFVYQSVGDVVSMPRVEVKHDPNKTCERGLHVGDFSYARSYGNTTAEVWFDPRDIVSVPTDAGGRKMRVCRYLFKSVVTAERDGDKPVIEDKSAALAGDVEAPWSDVGYQAP